jgi:putative flippase GtrA
VIAQQTRGVETRTSPPRIGFLKQLARQLAWYLVNGGLATALDWCVFAVLKGPYGVDYRVAVAVSFACGAACNFQLQKRITFGDREACGRAQVAVYLVIVGASLLATVGLMAVFVGVGMSGMAARIVTTAVMTTANFLCHRSVTFNRRFYGRLRQLR